jgi:methyl-accepting chemotaxis protein
VPHKAIVGDRPVQAGANMPQRNERRPVRNFFIKKSLQLKIIFKILLVVLLSAVITTAALTVLYDSKSRNGSFYYMSNDTRQDLELKNILEFILPSVVAAQVFSIVIGLGIGLFSSRKMAVPIYKFEKWVSQLRSGNLNTKISFREDEEMKELTEECNAMADTYRDVFRKISEELSAIEKGAAGNRELMEQVERMKNELEKVRFD